MKYISIWNNKGITEQGKDCLIRSSGYEEPGGSVGGRRELSPVEGCTCHSPGAKKSPVCRVCGARAGGCKVRSEQYYGTVKTTSGLCPW